MSERLHSNKNTRYFWKVAELLFFPETGQTFLSVILYIYHLCSVQYDPPVFMQTSGIIECGNSFNIKRILTLQKKIIRIMAGSKPRNSCRNPFKKLKMLPLPCECIFSLMNFIVNNLERFQTNSTKRSLNTRNINLLHRPVANFSRFQKGVYYASIKSSKVYHLVSKLLRKKRRNLKLH
jgi:hypothetical protein